MRNRTRDRAFHSQSKINVRNAEAARSIAVEVPIFGQSVMMARHFNTKPH
jgi:hypothetical protein